MKDNISELINKTDAELLQEISDLTHDVDLIEHSLDMAMAEENAGGQRYDRKWKAKAEYAMKCKRRQATSANRVLKQRRTNLSEEVHQQKNLLKAIGNEIGIERVQEIMMDNNINVYIFD